MVKILLKIIKILLAIIVVVLTVFVIANLGDEELKPEVKKALNWQPPEHALDKDNGFLILLGMDAPAEQNAWQVGKQRLEAEFTRYKIAQQIHKEPPNNDLITSNPDKEREHYRCDYFKEQNCVDFYLKQDTAKMNAAFAAYKVQQTRFNAIKQSKYFVEAVPPSLQMTSPPYWSLATAYDMNRIKAVILISSGKIEQGVSSWMENALFSRRFLRESSTLVSRMLAIAIVQRDMRVLSELLTKYPQLATYRTQLLPVLEPFPGAEFKMIKPMEFERDLHLQIMSNIPFQLTHGISPEFGSWEKSLNLLFYQANASDNLFYDFGTLRVQLAESDALHLDQTNSKVLEKQKELLGFGFEFLYLRNPIGKILASIAQPAYINYIERQHDTDGYMRLVSLQLELAAENNLNEDRIKHIMVKHPNPYTGKPMDFDPKTKQITFTGRQPSRVNVGESKTYRINLTTK